MKYIFTAFLTIIALASFGQTDGEIIEMKGSNNGQIKKIKKHPKLTIRIDSLEIGDKKYSVNFQFEDKIKKQTGLLKINDSIALNVIFLKLKILGKDKLIYSH